MLSILSAESKVVPSKLNEKFPFASSRIGEVYVGKKEFDTALRYLSQSLSTFKNMHNQNQVMRTLYQIGQAHYGKGSYEVALSNTRELLAIANQTGARQQIINARKLLWQVFDRLQYHDSAYFYLRLYSSARDSAEFADYEKKLAFMKTTFDVEKKQAQIELLAKDNKIKEQRLQSSGLLRNVMAGGFIVLTLFGLIGFRYTMLKRRHEKLRLEKEIALQERENEKKQTVLQTKTVELEMQAFVHR